MIIIKVVKNTTDTIGYQENIMFKKLIMKMFITVRLYISIARFRNINFGTERNKVVKIIDTCVNFNGISDSLLLLSVTPNNIIVHVLVSVMKHVSIWTILNIS